MKGGIPFNLARGMYVIMPYGGASCGRPTWEVIVSCSHPRASMPREDDIGTLVIV